MVMLWLEGGQGEVRGACPPPPNRPTWTPPPTDPPGDPPPNRPSRSPPPPIAPRRPPPPNPPPPPPPPPPQGASGQQLARGVVGVQNRGVAPLPPRGGVRVEWRDGRGGRTSVLSPCWPGCRGMTPPWPSRCCMGWVGGRQEGAVGGMDPQRRGWVRVGEEGGKSNSRRSTCSSGTSSRARSPPQGPQAPPPAPHSKPKGKANPPPPSNPSPPPCRIGAGTPMQMCRVWWTPDMSLGRWGATGGPSAKGRGRGIGLRSWVLGTAR